MQREAASVWVARLPTERRYSEVTPKLRNADIDG
jgi:hypothetical protein